MRYKTLRILLQILQQSPSLILHYRPIRLRGARAQSKVQEPAIDLEPRTIVREPEHVQLAPTELAVHPRLWSIRVDRRARLHEVLHRLRRVENDSGFTKCTQMHDRSCVG